MEKGGESGNGAERLQTKNQPQARIIHRYFTQMCVYLQMFSTQVDRKQREHTLNVSKPLIEHYLTTFNHLMIKPLFLLAIYSFLP